VSVLGIGPLTIGATATAQVGTYGNPCVLALTGSVNSQSSLNAATCGVASNSTASNALTISNANNIGFMAAVGGCQGCSGRYLSSAEPTSNPYAQLDSDIGSIGSLANCPSGTLTPYTSASRCTNNNVTLNDNRNHALASGVYFISGNLRTTGTTSVTGTGVTFVLLPGAAISGSITATAPTQPPSSSSLPTALQSDASLLRYMGLYSASAVAVQLGSGVNIKGNIYAPSASVTAQGDLTSSGCSQIIAAAITLNGNTTLDNSGCPLTQTPTTPFVRLVQ
jgi:hypothetical protein